MIEVRITKSNGHELAKIEIENMPPHSEREGNYAIRFGVDAALGEVALFQRYIERFPRTQYNVLALLRQALETLTEEDLRLADGTDSPDLARQERGARSAIQLDRLHHH
jgi:hypothetical protein